MNTKPTNISPINGHHLSVATEPGDQHMPADREILTYEHFGDAVRELAQQIADTGFEPDVIIAVARGGLPIGGALAYALDVKAVGTLNVEFYTGIDQRLDKPSLIPPLLDTDALHGKRLLIVDDVADTGETLLMVIGLVTEMTTEFTAASSGQASASVDSKASVDSQASEIRTAVLYAKPQSVCEPDYVWRRTDKWITFPWSAKQPVRRTPHPGGTT